MCADLGLDRTSRTDPVPLMVAVHTSCGLERGLQPLPASLGYLLMGVHSSGVPGSRVAVAHGRPSAGIPHVLTLRTEPVCSAPKLRGR